MSGMIDNAMLKLKIWAGSCASVAGNEDIKAAIEQAEQALNAPHLISVVSGSRIDVAKVTEGLGAIKETLETVENVCLDAKAVAAIHGAVQILSQDSIMFTDKAAAAEAFSGLFAGVGRLARHLPSPAKEWGEFIEQCGVLFVNIQRANNPATGHRWRQLRQMDGMESLYR